MKTRELTCIGCPLGCALHVTLDSEHIEVAGNTCPRGAEYAKKEVLHPTRIVTSTVPVDNGTIRRVSVKTERDIPKEKMFDCIHQLQGVRAAAPVRIGDVLLEDCAGTGVRIIATKNVGVSGRE